MDEELLEQAAALIEKVNSALDPLVLSSSGARRLFSSYEKLERLSSFGKTVLAPKLRDASEISRLTGTSMGQARRTLEQGKALREAEPVSRALAKGEVSLEQATEIAGAENADPGAGAKLLELASKESFQVLREEARRIKLQGEQERDLSTRQHEARRASHYLDPLGMVRIELSLEPHVGAPVMRRAEQEAKRLSQEAKREKRLEPFERHLLDAYLRLLSGKAKESSSKAELVVVVSHEVTKRGWNEVRKEEVCKIPGVGPISSQKAKEIAEDAFLTGVFYQGKELIKLRRWTRKIPVEVRLALNLGPPPDFPGMRCNRCGKRLFLHKDHIDPHSSWGPASIDNLQPLCLSCHQEKTAEDRRQGKLGKAHPPKKGKESPGKEKPQGKAPGGNKPGGKKPSERELGDKKLGENSPGGNQPGGKEPGEQTLGLEMRAPP